MAKYPWMQFYPADWLSDAELGKCCAATRGIWIDMCCHMHTDDRCGMLAGTVPRLTQICRCTEAEMDHAIAELVETADVTKPLHVTLCNDHVTLVNRRMRRAWLKRNSSYDRVKRFRDKEVTQPQRDRNAVVTPHILYTRSYKLEKTQMRVCLQAVQDAWNKMADVARIAKVQRIAGARARTLTTRLADDWWAEHWQAAIDKIPSSDFLTGRLVSKDGKAP